VGVRRGARGLQAERESGAASVEHGAMFRESAAGRSLTVHRRWGLLWGGCSPWRLE
jgi:hypothetical protein